MTSADSNKVDQRFLANAMASFLQIGALLLLLIWCFEIVRPFIGVMVWAMIIAVAIYPLHLSLTAKLGGREKSSVFILVLIGLSIIFVPTWVLGESAIVGLKVLATDLKAGTLTIPAPNPDVAGWPVIGEKVYEIWSAAASNLEATLGQYEEQLKGLGHSVVGFATGIIAGVFQFVFAEILKFQAPGLFKLIAHGASEANAA